MTLKSGWYHCNMLVLTRCKLSYEIQCCSRTYICHRSPIFHNRGYDNRFSQEEHPYQMQICLSFSNILPNAHVFHSPLDGEALSVCSSACAFWIFRVAHCRRTDRRHYVLCVPVDNNVLIRVGLNGLKGDIICSLSC